MSKRELIFAIVAFSVVGGTIIIACLVSAWRNGFAGLDLLWNLLGVVVVATALAVGLPSLVRELRSRRQNR